MAKQATIVQEPALASENGAVEGLRNPNLEQRVQRLEDAVAGLQDTHLAEERVFQRVQILLKDRQAAPAPSPPMAQQVYDAARFSVPRPSAAPVPEPVRPVPAVAVPARLPYTPWFLVELAAELRAMVVMFFDRGYRTAWTTRLALLFIVPMILLSHWWFPLAWVPLIGSIVDKVVDLTLALVLFKALSREANRYRQVRHGVRR